METQVLHLEADAWRPYSYVWNNEQTDAVLADAAGATATVPVATSGGQRAVNYRIQARTECLSCHNPWVEKKTTVFGVQSASPLGVNTVQLNKNCGPGAAADNQLVQWRRMGLLAWAPDVARLPKLVDPYDESVDLDLRARSYLQTNCAHCHQSNAGGAANIALGFDMPLNRTGTVGERPIQGTFQIAGARIIVPGDPASSVLYYRISKLGGGRMPRMGSNVVDDRGTRMIHDWIAGMPPSKAVNSVAAPVTAAPDDRAAIESLRKADRLAPAARSAVIVRLASTTRGALLLLGLIDRDHVSEALSREVIAIARNSPLVEVRDLFERFIPEDERTQRLGDVVDRTAILALRGDAARGRLIFTADAAARCKSCHKVGDIGESVGPDLTKIGAKYTKAVLLDQILEPSKTIDPRYTTYLLETRDGRVLSGLAVEKNKDRVVLKDAQGKTITVPGAEIDRLVPQPRSLMPELLLRDLTARQVADLLEFLGSSR
jgi:putative heme-binding domain-containing protein